VKGITRTAAEVELHDKVAQLGCICCRIDGFEQMWVSIHHCNGRTKPGCHQDVLPLCSAHHVKEHPDVLARHGNKSAWEAKYGKEYDLVDQIMREIGHPYVRPELRERPAPSTRKKSPSSKPKVINPANDKPRIKRQIPMAQVSRPAAKVKIPGQKAKPSEAQLQFIAEQKAKQKSQQAVRQAVYELDKDKIDAMKDKAREQAKAQRQKIAADRKAKAKSDKAKAKRAA
jgi:hypothetical protein